jgi:hypothetical protein
MRHHYRFQIQQIKAGKGHHFQLTIGMDWNEAGEFIPAHRSAFAGRLEFAAEHATEIDASMELGRLLVWIDERAA